MEVLRIPVSAHDCAGIGVDLVVILRVGRTRAADELDLVLQAAVVTAQLALDKHHVVRGEARIRQRDLTRTAHGDGRTGCCSGIAAGGIVGVVVGHFTGQEHRAVGRVPLDIHAHHFTDRAQRQIDRTFVQQRIDYLAVHVAEGARHAVNHDGIVGTNQNGDILRDRRGIRRALRRGRCPFAADRRRQVCRIPVDILAHQFADRADRHIGGAAVVERMYLIALCVVEGLYDTADADRYVRPQSCLGVIRRARRARRAAQQRGEGHGADQFFHGLCPPLSCAVCGLWCAWGQGLCSIIENRLSVPVADGTAVCVDFEFILHVLVDDPAFVLQAAVILIQI